MPKDERLLFLGDLCDLVALRNRLRDQMLNHGLDQPILSTDTGYFQVSFPGPGENLDRIRAPEPQLSIAPATEVQLNDRQMKILQHALKSGEVTRRWCVEKFSVANDTAGRDLKFLMELGLVVSVGKGRAVKYVPKIQSTDNRPTKS